LQNRQQTIRIAELELEVVNLKRQLREFYQSTYGPGTTFPTENKPCAIHECDGKLHVQKDETFICGTCFVVYSPSNEAVK